MLGGVVGGAGWGGVVGGLEALSSAQVQYAIRLSVALSVGGTGEE